MAVFGHLIDFAEIILVISISMLNSSGEEIDVTLYFLDDQTPRDCSSNVACFFPEDKTAWIRADKLDKRDTCGRSPIIHELMHAKYPNKDIHGKCYLDKSLFITRANIIDIWSTTT